MGRHLRNNKLPFIRNGWIGNRVHKGHFVNKDLAMNHGVKNFLEWRFTPNPQFKEKFFENWSPEVYNIDSLDEIANDTLVWLGHSSFYIVIDGKRIMFDPIFGSIPFVKRKSKLPAKPSIFKDIDYIMISHDHFDHLDKKSIKEVCENSPNVIVLCGIGVDELILHWLPKTNVIPMAWYQQFKDGSMKFTFMPAKHWGKRSVQDGGKRLWGAFVVESYSKTIYYSGDTGYGTHFHEIPQLIGRIDYAIMGIGAYKPRWMMEKNHIGPDEAIQATIDMGAEVVIPMHYGTFDLSDEPMGDPPKVFRSEAQRRGVKFKIPIIGEQVRL